MPTAPSSNPVPPRFSVLHGDSWRSQWFAVALGGQAPDLEAWTIRAQVRESATAAPLFVWTVGGPEDRGGIDVAGPGVVEGTAKAKLSGGAQVDLPALRLRLVPHDWIGKPVRRKAQLEIELVEGDPTEPAERYTLLRRGFEIIADLP